MRAFLFPALGAASLLAGSLVSAQPRPPARQPGRATPKPVVCLLPYIEQQNLRYAGALTRLTGKLLSASEVAVTRSLPLKAWGASEIDLKAIVRQNKSLAPLAARVGKTAGADYVLFGSLRKKGDAVVEVSSYLLPLRRGSGSRERRGTSGLELLTQRFTVRISKDQKAMHRQAEAGMRKTLNAFVEQERARRG